MAGSAVGSGIHGVQPLQHFIIAPCLEHEGFFCYSLLKRLELSTTMDWVTKEKDLNTAKAVLGQYFADADSKMVGLRQITIVQEGSIHIERADWIVELEELFEKQYGAAEGTKITQNVIATLLKQGKTVH